MSQALVVDYLDAFYNYLNNEKRLSENSLDAYRRQLTAIFSKHPKLKLSQLDVQFVRLILSQAKLAQLKSASIHLRLSALRSFCQYLVKKEALPLNPADAVSAPKKDKRLPKNLDVDQVNQLLDNSNNEVALNLRDNAMLELLYSSGLRLSELINADIKHVKFDTKTFEVKFGKGGNDRVVPVTQTALDKISDWLAIRPNYIKPNTDQALFISTRGSRLSARYVRERIRQAGVKTGLNVHLNPHKMRHSFATHMLESSQDLRAVQELLGHQNLSTTQIYTHLDFEHLAKVYDQAHPRAKRKSDK
ncbi:tyrosine recombinase XerC [Catenovulum sp. 2E275]|uniref:tyrosine recombinase XerC n=1 Tax=Catenovulum sp. 2E275 TaxID=2980497 RepID=UPI0021D0F3C5|nr:tyrosine recombinase XerC [Catenovulum sp. 2E275]MCU4675099.1 tyrosine recombinase XerC [Catenovulum sp. 2E275]